MPEKERKKEMSLYTKVNTDLNFVEREHEVEQFWDCLLYTSRCV